MQNEPDESGLTALERGVADAQITLRNATDAYLEVRPNATLGTARAEGPAILSRPHVKKYLEARWREISMPTDELLAHLVEIARGVPASCRKDTGLIDVRKLKARGLGGLIAGAKKTNNGLDVKIESRQGALRTLLEMAGKIAPESTRAALERLAAAIEGD